ncbi:unnamed protein product [Boreogadus saida]
MADSELGVLRRVRSEFIQRVSDPVIKGLLDDLTDHEVFSTEEKDSVMEEKSRADVARCLIDMVIGKGERASLMMIDCMKKRDKHLCITLGLISSPAGGLKAVPSKKVKLKMLFSRARDKKTHFAGQDLSDEQLLQVAKTLGQAALHLELKTKDLDDIKADRQTDVAMQKQKMLVLWTRRRPPGKATAQDLLRGLKDMEDLPVETRLLLTELGRIHSELIYMLSDDDVINLLHYLRKMDVLNDQEMKTVEGKMTSKDRARCLIDTVMRKGERGSCLMVDYLSERHPNLCWTLGLTPTSARIKLGRLRSKLINWLSDDNVFMLLHYLRKMDVLNDQEKKTLEGKITREDRARCLIDTVMRKGEGESSLMVDYLTERHPVLCWTLGLTPATARISFPTKMSFSSHSLPLVMHEGYSELGTSLTEDMENMSLMDRYEEKDCSDSDASAEIDEDDEDDEEPDLSDKQLLEVVKTLGQEWEQVAIHLKMDDIKADGQTDVAMQKLKMLAQWRHRRPPGKATAQDLLRALEDLEDLPVQTFEILEGELRRIRSEFVMVVSTPVIKGLLDDLWQQKVFSTDEMDSVMDERSRADRARCLIAMVNCKGERASQMMIDSMKERDGHLCINPGSDLFSCWGPQGGSKAKEAFFKRDKKTRSAGRDLSDKHLMKVAETLGQEWEQAAIHLGLKIKDLDDIKAEHRSVAMQKLKMLVLWKRRRPPGEATAQDLLRGLEDMKDIPVETRQLLRGRPLSNEQLLKVAETLGQEWEQMAIHLDLKTEDLDGIKAENMTLIMQKYKMLQLWQSQRPFGKDTAQDLLRGLEDMEDLPVETRLLLTGFGRSQESFGSGQESPGQMSPSLPLEMQEGDSELGKFS